MLIKWCVIIRIVNIVFKYDFKENENRGIVEFIWYKIKSIEVKFGGKWKWFFCKKKIKMIIIMILIWINVLKNVEYRYLLLDVFLM